MAQRSAAATRLIAHVGDIIAEAIRRRKLSRTSAAKILMQPESYISKSIRGRNVTLRTLADLLASLGYEAMIVLRNADDAPVRKKSSRRRSR